MCESEEWILLKSLIEHNYGITKNEVESLRENNNHEDINNLIGSQQAYKLIIEAMNDIESR